MEHNPLRGLFGVSSPRPVEQRVSPQPTENVYFEIPLGMIEKLLANPFTGDGNIASRFAPNLCIPTITLQLPYTFGNILYYFWD